MIAGSRSYGDRQSNGASRGRGTPLSEQFTENSSVEGEVADVRPYGVMVKLGEFLSLLHRNQMADDGDDRADPQSFSPGQKVTVSCFAAAVRLSGWCHLLVLFQGMGAC